MNSELPGWKFYRDVISVQISQLSLLFDQGVSSCSTSMSLSIHIVWRSVYAYFIFNVFLHTELELSPLLAESYIETHRFCSMCGSCRPNLQFILCVCVQNNQRHSKHVIQALVRWKTNKTKQKKKNRWRQYPSVMRQLNMLMTHCSLCANELWCVAF